MIKKLYECGCFDYKKYILNHQKELLLSADSANILILMLDEYNNDPSFSMSLIKDKLIISDESFDQSVSKLLERGYYSIYLQENNGISVEAISLDGFFDCVEDILNNTNPKDMENEFFQITQMIQKEFNRILKADELDIVSSLINDDRVKANDIKEALAYMKDHYKNASMKNLVTSLTRFRETKKEEKEAPSYVKDFLKSVK